MEMDVVAETGNYVIGVDIGGTCTDVAMIDSRTKRQFFFKTETTPLDIEQGVVSGVAEILKQQNRRPEECAAFIHGTTLALNAVLTRNGAKVGLIVTRGFGDVLEIGRLQMPDPFNFYTQKPRPLVRKNFVREIDERILGNGRVDTPLDVAGVEQAADELIERGAELLAICFINGFKNASHEEEAAQIIRKRHPSIPLSLSSEVWPEIREYERTMVTVMNAFVTPKVATYLDRLQDSLNKFGLNGPVNITTSNGGMLPARLVRDRPGTTLLSGPASGIIASTQLAATCKLINIIAFDMGGTSSDFAVISNAEIPYSSETRIGDLPVIFPCVDVVSVGAGGGSIARLDNLGVLKVGPESAGADPGPVCYGRGGTAPTTTDAYLMTGILDGNNFLGGRVKLDGKRAKQAIADLAKKTKYSADEFAEGMLRVATSNLMVGIGKIEGRIGIDIRDFTILAYGGAGPTHACLLAEELGIRRVVVPLSPGTFCALGSLSADFRMDFVQTINAKIPTPDWTQIREWFAEKEKQAATQLEPDRDLIETVVAVRSGDARFEGQGFNTEVSLSKEMLRKGDSDSFAAAFHARYEQLYGVAQAHIPGELVNIRLTVIGRRKQNPPMMLSSRAVAASPASKREVYFDGQRRAIPVFRRTDLGVGAKLTGPCIVDQEDTTTFIRANWNAEVDVYGILHLTRT
jgi:N-methylhydantoinase A